MIDRRYMPFILAIGVFLAVVILIQLSVNFSSRQQFSQGKMDRRLPSLEESPVVLPQAGNPVPPASPEAFQIKTQTAQAAGRSQLQWETDMKNIWTPEAAARLRNGQTQPSGIKKSREEYQKQLELVQAQIDRYEQLQREKPDNAEIEQRLQDLYMIKGTLTALEDQIVQEK